MRKTRYPTSLDDFGLRLSITERNDRIAKDGEHLTLEDVAFAVRALQERLTTLALPVAYGGTGLTSVGAAGTVLQSDGTGLYFGELPESQSGGITSLNGLTGSVQTFADTDDTNVTLTITSAAAAHTFALGWTGQLAVSRGGTGASSLTGYVYGNGASAFTASATIPASAITAATFASAGPSQYRFPDEVRIDGLLGVGRDATTYAIEVNGSLAFYGTNLITGAGGGTVTWQGQPIGSAYLGSHTHAASDIASGTLATARGGTNLGTFTANGLMYASSTSVLATSTNLSTNGDKITKYNAYTTAGYGLAPFLYQAAAAADAAVTATTMVSVDGFYRVSGSLDVSAASTNATYTLNVIFTAPDQDMSTITKAICSVQTVNVGTASGSASGVLVFDNAIDDNVQWSLTKSGGNSGDTVVYSITLEKLRDGL